MREAIHDVLWRESSLNDEIECLIQTVGSNPLPSLISSTALNPKRIILIHSKETRGVAKRLKKTYKMLLMKSKLIMIDDATEAKSCSRILKPSMGEYNLDYTGGTKVMSCAIRTKWMDLGGNASRCSYVDDRSEVVRFDNGVSKPIRIILPLNAMVQIHGFKIEKKWSKTRNGPTIRDAEKVAEKILKKNFYKYKNRLYEGSHNIPIRTKKFNLDLSQKEIHYKMPEATISNWQEFFKGKWMEIWLAHLIESLPLKEEFKVDVGVHVSTGNGGLFELDVLVVHRHRLYLVSCTTSSSFTTAKMKLFEAHIRSKQIGGSLARSAILAPIGWVTPKYGKPFDQVDALENLVKRTWDSPNPPKVFGLRHMEEWAGVRGAAPDISTLLSWFEQ